MEPFDLKSAYELPTVHTRMELLLARIVFQPQVRVLALLVCGSNFLGKVWRKREWTWIGCQSQTASGLEY
jgi:hypothetical protein